MGAESPAKGSWCNVICMCGRFTLTAEAKELAKRIKPDYAEARAKLRLAQQALTKLQEHGASGQR